MNWKDNSIRKQWIQVGSFVVQRVPSSTAQYRSSHNGIWRGYLFPLRMDAALLGEVGKLIEARSALELDAACAAYRASLAPGADTRLAYYEVIDPNA